MSEPVIRNVFRYRVMDSILHAAAKLKRLPLWMRSFALFPAPKNGVVPKRQPWSGVVMLENKRP